MAAETQAKQKGEAKPKVESKPMVENKAEAGQPKKKSKLFIIVGAVVLVAVLGGTAFLALPYIKGNRGDKAKGKGEQAVAKKEEIKATLPLEPFLVNLADPDEARFVKTTFQLALAEAMEKEGEGSAAVPAMRDSIITLLSSKTSDQILTPQGKEKLREEIKSRINKISSKIKVVEVYIVDFVVQL
jgi:flagellar protein FliL